MQLLIVQGDQDVRRSLEAAAEESERFWWIRSMADGRFALEHIAHCLGRDPKLVPDVVVLDVRAPGLNGVQLTHELRRYEGTRSLFIACLASRTNPTDQDAAENAGCDFFLPLPATQDELVKTLNSIANRCVAKATYPARLLN